MSNSTELITLRRMVRDLLLSFDDSTIYMPVAKARLEGIYNRIGLMLFDERIREEDKLAETSDEEDGQESGDHPSHLKVVETRRTGTQIRGGDLTIEVGLQNPDSEFSRLEGGQADWQQFYTADGMPKPHYNRKKP